MNLKFDEIQWTDKGLMYVSFKRGNQRLKWFPEWGDVAYLAHTSQWTEEEKHGGRWRPFFEIMGCEALVTSIVDRIGNISPESVEKVMASFHELRQTFWRNLGE